MDSRLRNWVRSWPFSLLLRWLHELSRLQTHLVVALILEDTVPESYYAQNASALDCYIAGSSIIAFLIARNVYLCLHREAPLWNVEEKLSRGQQLFEIAISEKLSEACTRSIGRSGRRSLQE